MIPLILSETATPHRNSGVDLADGDTPSENSFADIMGGENLENDDGELASLGLFLAEGDVETLSPQAETDWQTSLAVPGETIALPSPPKNNQQQQAISPPSQEVDKTVAPEFPLKTSPDQVVERQRRPITNGEQPEPELPKQALPKSPDIPETWRKPPLVEEHGDLRARPQNAPLDAKAITQNSPEPAKQRGAVSADTPLMAHTSPSITHSDQPKGLPKPVIDLGKTVDTERFVKEQLADIPLQPRSPTSRPTSVAAPAILGPSPALLQHEAALKALSISGGSVAGAEVLSGDIGLTNGTSERAVSTSLAPTGAPPTAGAETARHVANQIAVAVSAQPGRPTEISLNPEELGRVRLSVMTIENGITVTVLAERPETNDLMRRHIDVLNQEFKALGYEDISFAFGEAPQDHAGQETRADGSKVQETPLDDSQDHRTKTAHPSSGLDLRL